MHGWLARATLALAVLAAACNRGGTLAPGSGLSPTRENAYRANNLGVALLEQFKYDEAAAQFRRALGLDPSLAIAHINLSVALLEAQDLPGAAREAAEGARLLPSAPQAPYILGLVARAENRDRDAVRFFQRVLEIDPRDAGAGINLAQVYLQDRQYPEAIALLRPAVADEPYNITAAYSLGLALTRAGGRDEGQRLLEESQKLRATGYATTYGNQYLEQGRYAEAIASTGAEPDLVDGSPSPATFSSAPVGAALQASGVALVDFDRDGDLDVFAVGPAGQRLLRNDGHGTFVDVTAASGLAGAAADSGALGAVAGDYNNDGAPDLFVLRRSRSSLYRNDGNGRFTDATARAGLPAHPSQPGAAALVDVDHDGDLDLVIAGQMPPAFLRLLRNNSSGTFTDITRAAGIDASARGVAPGAPLAPVAVVPTDFDNRRDIDLLIVNRDAPPMLFKNMRDGTFRDVAADVGLAAVAGAAGGHDEITAVAAGDINKDDFPDFFFARSMGGVFALSDGRGRFTLTPAPDGARSATAAQLIDYDNDGLLDLLTWSAEGPHLFRNLGRRWTEIRAMVAPAGNAQPPLNSAAGLAAADLDGDGNTDLVTAGAGGVLQWRNSGDPRHQSLRVQLKGRASNRLGVGSKIQLRAGSLRARLEASAATPAVAPADIVFGLGARAAADVVRVLWPSGVLQAETSLTSPLVVEELDRKPSSCPFLFAWNGERFEFVTDFMGGGEMGYWESPGERNRPNPIEYVRIRADQMRAKDGRFDIRVTNELEEALFVDRLRLVAVAHPAGVDVFPNEGMTDPPKRFRLFAVRDQHPPARVVDDHGHDVRSRVARVDRQYPDDFTLAAIRGFAEPHTLTIDVRDDWSPSLLLLTGWTDYAFSSDNLAGHQAGLTLQPPSLQIRDAAGAWRTAIADIGIPVGRPQTIVVDLARELRRGEHEIRISTNMRIYWDQILVGRSVATDLKTTSIDPGTARLRARGFSAEVRPDGKDPPTYDYHRVTAESPWKTMTGRYTREGDVRELLTTSDDMFVIAKPGDEIALGFDAARVGELRAGWTRTFLLVADGFSKEMDVNSAGPDTVEPLPFHRMTKYPYRAPEQYPDTPAHRSYRDRYNTRPVPTAVPSLDGLKTRD